MEVNKIYQIDAYEGIQQLDDDSIDLVLTDPPYGKNIKLPVNQDNDSHNAKRSEYGEIEWDLERVEEKYLKEIKRVSKNQIIFGYNYYADLLGPTNCVIVWDKQTKSNLADCELAYTSFDSGVKKYQWLWDGYWQENMVEKDERVHPTQKPVGLFKAILNDYSDKGDLILDSFIGSGTTAVAAKALDRKYIGFEQDEEYIEIARERLSNVQKELIR